MTFEKSRRPVLVLATLALGAVALGAQPAAAFAKPAFEAHQSMARSGTQAPRDGYAVFPARRPEAFVAAPRSTNAGTCDVGDNEMICS
jgi:hypothetical protein